MTKYENKRIYAVYKGQQFITEGTSDEICEALGIKKNTFYYQRNPAWRRRCKPGGNSRTIIRIDNIAD